MVGVLTGKVATTVELDLVQVHITVIKLEREYVRQLRKKRFQQRNQLIQDK
jgi:hypothetical protein